MNLPSYDFLSAPLWLITGLHILTLTLHFVAMNFLVGGILVVLLGRFQNGWQDDVVRRFVKLFPTVMAFTITLGVAPLLFVQLVYPKQVYSAAIVSGWFWLLIIVVAIVSYYLLYTASFSKPTSVGLRRTCYILVLLGLGYISLVYSSVFSMAEDPDLMKALYAADPSGRTLNTDVGSYLARWLHMLSGALTVGSFLVGFLGRDDETAYRTGRRFFLVGMIMAFLLGAVYTMTLGEHLAPFMRTPAGPILLVSILLSLGAIHFFCKRRFAVSGSMLFVSMAGMVTLRHLLRLVRLEEHFDPASLPVQSQWDVFAIFLACFVIGIAVIAYMLKLYFSRDFGHSSEARCREKGVAPDV